jgi:hypothetical protein
VRRAENSFELKIVGLVHSWGVLASAILVAAIDAAFYLRLSNESRSEARLPEKQQQSRS